MKEVRIKVIENGCVGCPIRVACAVLAIAVAISYAFVFYFFLPTPYGYIIIAQQVFTCFIGVFGAVTCSQCFIRIYLAKQALLFLPTVAAVAFVVYEIINKNENNCTTEPDECDLSSRWFHIRDLPLSWIVMIAAVVGTGLLVLTICCFKQLTGYRTRRYGFRNRQGKLNCEHGCGNHDTTTQPIQQNPQTTVVINQSMPMMNGFMGRDMTELIPESMMMPQANQADSTVYAIPMGFQSQSTATQDEQQTMINQYQLAMSQIYPWIFPMPIMQQAEAVLPILETDNVDESADETFNI